MLNKFTKKLIPLSLIGAMLFSSAANFSSASFAGTTTPAKPPALNSGLFLEEKYRNTPADALKIIEGLLSTDVKNLRTTHDRKHPTSPFIKNVKISEAATFSTNICTIGKFSNGLSKKTDKESILNFDRGYIFSTGDVASAASPSNFSSHTESRHEFNVASTRHDKDLANLIGVTADDMKDTVYLEFDIFCPPDTENVMFEYALASEEYNEYTKFNDVFGIFVNGKNIASIPNSATTDPVTGVVSEKAISISNINHYTNTEFFRNNTKDSAVVGDSNGTDKDFLDLPSPYDGFTTTFAATSPLIPNQYNHFKFAIADNRDTRLDSALFLKADTIQFRAPQYGVIDLKSWNFDTNEVTLVRSEGVDNAVSVDLCVQDISGNIIKLKDEDGTVLEQLPVRFDNGQATKTITLPAVSQDDFIAGKLPKYVSISNARLGATLGSNTRIEQTYETPSIKFGEWTYGNTPNSDTITLIRTGSAKFSATVDVSMKDIKNNAVGETTKVRFAANEIQKNITVQDKVYKAILSNPQATTIGDPSSITRTITPTPEHGKKRIQFTVVENSEVVIDLDAVGVNSPKFNYKITKLPKGTSASQFVFYGDGRNKKTGMKDLYYMEPGDYILDIYWLDPKQAETQFEINRGISKTKYDIQQHAIGANLDKKKFYKKIN